MRTASPKSKTVVEKHSRKRDASDQLQPASTASGLTLGLRCYVYATAALSGAAVLIIEILGAKMLAPYVGTSHFVWTAQIAVTLVALAAGYALGGWVADRSSQLRQLYTAMMLAALWLCGAAWACEPVAFACLPFGLELGSLLASIILFFVPLALLAMVGPLCIRRLTSSVSSVGKRVGALTAISTLGSVGGTLLIGYVLIPHLPNTWILYVSATYLTILSLGYFLVWSPRHRSRALSGAAAIFLSIAAGSRHQPFENLPGVKELFRANSNFGLIQVVESQGPKPIRFLLTDLLTQNAYDARQHVAAALFNYMEDGLIGAYHPDNVRDVLFIGLGAGMTPMRMARNGVGVDVVEINPVLVSVAQRFFDFDPNRIRVVIGDGRYFLHEGSKLYDAIILDAFLGESPPSHLMTREAFQSIQKRLRPGGLLVINSFGEFEDGEDYVPASLYKTLNSVFRNVRMHVARAAAFFVASDSADFRIVRQPDFSAVPEPLLVEMQQAFKLVGRPDPNDGAVLTDNYNPVEYRDAAYREEIRRRLLAHLLAGLKVKWS